MELTGVVVEMAYVAKELACVVMGIADIVMELRAVAMELEACGTTLSGVVTEHLTFVGGLDGATKETVAVATELVGVVMEPETVNFSAVSICFDLSTLTS